MKKIMIATMILIVSLHTIIYAKRSAPKKIKPLRYKNMIIKVIHSDMGYISIYNTQGKLLWKKRIYRVFYNPFLERDVQDVYIKKILIHKGLLIIINEENRCYSLNLQTKEVHSLGKKEINLIKMK